MKGLEPFGKLVRTCTTLIFFLSVVLVDVHASEAGQGLPFGTPHFAYDNFAQAASSAPARRAPTRVAGFVTIATDSATSTPTSTPPIVPTSTPPLTPTSTPPTTSTTTPEGATGLDRAIERVTFNLERHPNKGLENARERLLENRERKLGNNDTPTSTGTSTAPLALRRELTELKNRLHRLQLKISEHEQRVVEREKQLVKRINQTLINRLKGKILLSVEKNGEAYYVNPTTGTRLYLRDGATAYEILRGFGLGISTVDLEKIPVGLESGTSATDSDSDGLHDKLEQALGTDPLSQDSDSDGIGDSEEVKLNRKPSGAGTVSTDRSLVNRMNGKFLLQVSGDNAKGQAWYVKEGKRYYMPDGDTAYRMMQRLSTGITNKDLEQIPIESINLEESAP